VLDDLHPGRGLCLSGEGDPRNEGGEEGSDARTHSRSRN